MTGVQTCALPIFFLTGQNEITGVCKKLDARFGPKALSDKKRKHSAISKGQRVSGDSDFTSSTTVSAGQGDLEAEDMDFGARQEELATDVDDGIMDADEIGNDAGALDSDSDEGEEIEDSWDDVGGKYLQLPLPYVLINPALQHRCI